MSEVRIKQKTFAIGTSTVLILIFYLILRDRCETQQQQQQQYQQQQLPQKQQQQENAEVSPFTVYAITPTYARPVQKAELTRYLVGFNQIGGKALIFYQFYCFS